MEEIKKQIKKLVPPVGYERLYDVFRQAIHQAAFGKGKERHSSGEPFEEQPICVIARWVGIGAPLGQAIKKTRESVRLLEIKGPDAAIFEILGAINWLAAAIIIIKEMPVNHSTDGSEQTLLTPKDIETIRKGYCHHCGGIGTINAQFCPECCGKGTYEYNKDIECPICNKPRKHTIENKLKKYCEYCGDGIYTAVEEDKSCQLM